MTHLPVVERELRVASRRVMTHWGRVVAGAVAMGVIGWLVLMERSARPEQVGRMLFTAGISLAFLFALSAGGAYSSDAISGERREGTLGLLFLTDLKGRDIAVGKLLATSLGCVSYLLAAVPVLTLSLLLGGISGWEIGRMLLVLGNTLFFSLAAGLLASTFAQSAQTAGGVAALIAMVATFGMPVAGALLGLGVDRLGVGTREWREIMESVFLWPTVGAPLVAGFESNYRGTMGAGIFWASTAFTHVLAWVCFAAAAWRLPRIWQDDGRIRGAGGEVLRPRARSGGGFPERRRRLLDLGPLVWLSERRPWRLWAVWIFLAALGVGFLMLGMAFGSDWLDGPGYLVTSVILHLTLKVWIGGEAPRQFLEDRRSGAMELLLASPQTVAEILGQRFLSLRRQFLGPMIAVSVADGACLLASLAAGWDGDAGEWVLFWLLRTGFLWADGFALAWTGMWIGLSARGPRVGGSTFGRVVGLPWLMVFGAGTVLGTSGSFNTLGFTGVMFVWMAIGLGNDFYWYTWSRSRLLSEFRERASIRPGERRGKNPPEAVPSVGA